MNTNEYRDSWKATVTHEAMRNLLSSITSGWGRDFESEKLNVTRLRENARTGLYSEQFTLVQRVLAAYDREMWDYAEMYALNKEVRGW